MKFASNLDVEIATVLTLAANSHADRMHCAYRIIIDQRVFVVMVLLAIQMILIWVVNQVNNFEYQIHARVILTVHQAKFVSLELMESKIVSIHVLQLLVD